MATYKLKKIKIEYDDNGNLIHYKNFNGDEYWQEYDNNGNLIHYKDSDGFENWKEYDDKNNLIHYKDSDGSEYWKDNKGNKITEEEFSKIWEKIEE